jgi:hypothetical protein
LTATAQKASSKPEGSSGKVLARREEPKVTQNGPRTPSVKEDPSAAGKAGAAKREANALERIGQARGVMGAAAPRVARKAVAAALGQTVISATQATMLNSVLDRTVGKAPALVVIGPAEQMMDVLRALEDS